MTDTPLAADVDSSAEPPAGGVGGRLRRDGALTAGAGLITLAMSAVTGPLLARGLSEAARGDLTSIIVPTEVFRWLLTFGLPLAGMYFADQHHRRAIVTTGWLFSTVVGGIFIAATWRFIPGYLNVGEVGGHDGMTVGWFRAYLVLAVFFVPANCAYDLLIVDRRILTFNLIRFVPFTITFVADVVLYATGALTLRSAVIANFAGQAAYIATILVVTRAVPRWEFDGAVFREQLRYGAKVWPGIVAQFGVNRMDQIVLVNVVPSEQLAIYAICVTAALLSAPVAFAFAQVAFPDMKSVDSEASDRVFRQALRYTMIASGASAAAMAIGAPWVLGLFGPTYAEVGKPVLWLLLPGQVCMDAAGVVGARIQAKGRPEVVSLGLGLSVVITAVGLALAIGPFGIKGAAVVTTIAQFTYLGFLLSHLRRERRLATASE